MLLKWKIVAYNEDDEWLCESKSTSCMKDVPGLMLQMADSLRITGRLDTGVQFKIENGR